MTACSPVFAACRTRLARAVPVRYSGTIGSTRASPQGNDMRIALTSIAVVAIVALCAAAIVQLDAHRHPVALQLVLN